MAAAPEVFVVVRPPPSKTTNPLNLQVQLLTAQPSRDRPASRLSGEVSRSPAPSDSGASFDAVAGASVGLRRSPSVRSNRSGGSSATASSSATGGGAGRRPIIPLYNLEFHNLRETLVTDAGTDAKVAKFLKRGIEIVGLGILDPVDLPSTSALTPSSSPPAPRSPPSQQTLASPPQAQPSTGFFSKFKRLSFKPAPLPSKVDTSPPLPSTAQPVLPLFPEPEPDASKGGRPKSVISMQGVRRQGYSFMVRKWTRRDLEGPAGAQVASEVRFEWRRARRRGKSGAAPQTASAVNSAASSPEARHVTLPPMEEDGPSPKPSPPERATSSEFLTPATAGTRAGRSSSVSTMDGRPNLAATSSRSPDRSPASSIHQGDDGYDSDPEDSERPWVCEVVHGPVGAEGGQRRLLLGTLRPAPHHPRLVAHLAVPFSLVPVELGEGLADGLSVEEMKDCLSVTGLWVIVRENLGGLSNRKKGRG